MTQTGSSPGQFANQPTYQCASQTEGFVEVAVKASWTRETILKELIEERPGLRHLYQSMQNTSEPRTRFQQEDLGRRLEDGLSVKRGLEAKALLEILSSVAGQVFERRDGCNDVILDAVFQIPAQHATDFADAVDDLRKNHHGRLTISVETGGDGQSRGHPLQGGPIAWVAPHAA